MLKVAKFELRAATIASIDYATPQGCGYLALTLRNHSAERRHDRAYPKSFCGLKRDRRVDTVRSFADPLLSSLPPGVLPDAFEFDASRSRALLVRKFNGMLQIRGAWGLAFLLSAKHRTCADVA
jgi:hypothetical protein